MKRNNSHDVDINILIKGDPRNGRTLAGVGAGVRKAQHDAQKAADDEAARAAGRRERDDTRALIRKEQDAKRVIAIEEKKYRELGRLHMAQMRREEQADKERERRARAADRELIRRGTAMAREQEQQLRQAERNAIGYDRRRRAVQRERSAGMQQAMGGGIGMLQGALELGLAHSITNSGADERQLERIMQGVLAIQGAAGLARGGMGVVQGLGRAGMFNGAQRVGTRAAGGFLRGAAGVAGGLGLGGVGAIGSTAGVAATSVGAAGLAAGAGVGLAGYAGIDMFRQANAIGNTRLGRGMASQSMFGDNALGRTWVGMGRGAMPGSYTSGVANMSAGALTSTFGTMGMGRGAADFTESMMFGLDTPGSAAMRNAASQRELERAERREAARVRGRAAMVYSQQAAREYEERIEAPGLAFRNFSLSRSLDQQLERNRRTISTPSARARADLSVGAQGIDAAQQMHAAATTDQGRLSANQLLTRELQRQKSLYQELADIEKQNQANRATRMAAGLTERMGQLSGDRGRVRSFAEMDAGDRARTMSILQRAKSAKNFEGFRSSDFDAIRQFGDKDTISRLDRWSLESGRKQLGGDFASKDLAQSEAQTRQKRLGLLGNLPENQRLFGMGVAGGGKMGGVNFNANFSINLQRSHQQTADKIEEKIKEIAARVASEAVNAIKRDDDEANATKGASTQQLAK